MRTYTIDKERVSYLPLADVLYIGYGEHALDCCDALEDVAPGITVMTVNGEFSGAEIYDFAATYGGLPARVVVNGSNPFVLDIPSVPIG